MLEEWDIGTLGAAKPVAGQHGKNEQSVPSNGHAPPAFLAQPFRYASRRSEMSVEGESAFATTRTWSTLRPSRKSSSE